MTHIETFVTGTSGNTYSTSVNNLYDPSQWQPSDSRGENQGYSHSDQFQGEHPSCNMFMSQDNIHVSSTMQPIPPQQHMSEPWMKEAPSGYNEEYHQGPTNVLTRDNQMFSPSANMSSTHANEVMPGLFGDNQVFSSRGNMIESHFDQVTQFADNQNFYPLTDMIGQHCNQVTQFADNPNFSPPGNMIDSHFDQAMQFGDNQTFSPLTNMIGTQCNQVMQLEETMPDNQNMHNVWYNIPGTNNSSINISSTMNVFQEDSYNADKVGHNMFVQGDNMDRHAQENHGYSQNYANDLLQQNKNNGICMHQNKRDDDYRIMCNHTSAAI